MSNRLNLNFNLQTMEERNDFLHEYLSNLSFTPTEAELETCANYLLWGKEKDGKNMVQKKEIQIDTKQSTWNKTSRPVESLNDLIEEQLYPEALFKTINTTPIVIKRSSFDRQEARELASPDALERLEDLWKTIDSLDLIIRCYQGTIPKENLTSQQLKTLESLTPYRCLKLRHMLVSLRTEQYSIRDNWKASIQHEEVLNEPTPNSLVFGSDYPVLPLGLFKKSVAFSTIWLNPSIKDIERITLPEPLVGGRHFDFTNVEHIYHLIQYYKIFLNETDIDDIYNTNLQLLDTLQFYISHAKLTEPQKEILALKIEQECNSKIAAYINSKYNRHHTENYISTIFKKQIIPSICEAAIIHKKNYDASLNSPESFKQCCKCGELLLRDSFNFTRKKDTRDGYMGRCKMCDKRRKK